MPAQASRWLISMAAVALIALGAVGLAEPAYLVVLLDHPARVWLHTYWFVPFAGGIVIGLVQAVGGR
ncbi:MAG: hypothetical protein H6926_07620 [Chromatiales bacterium]|nr:hypothetical protein [Gammaproteobacteria bacterium]MCP5353036.1 hypothetical protein [Chromatiales bacterium]